MLLVTECCLASSAHSSARAALETWNSVFTSRSTFRVHPSFGHNDEPVFCGMLSCTLSHPWDPHQAEWYGEVPAMDFSEWTPRLASPLKMHLMHHRDTQAKAVAVPGDYISHPSQLFTYYIDKQGLPEFVLPPVFFILIQSDPDNK